MSAQAIVNRIENPAGLVQTGRSFLTYMKDLEETSMFKMPKVFDFPDHIQVRQGFFYMIGARPKVGKTTLACNIAYHNMQAGIKTHFISLEMPDFDVWVKIYQIHAQVQRDDKRSFIEWLRIFKTNDEAKANFLKFWTLLNNDGRLTVSRLNRVDIDEVCLACYKSVLKGRYNTLEIEFYLRKHTMCAIVVGCCRVQRNPTA